MLLIDAEPIKKFITNGLNTGEFGNDAIQILTEIEYAPPVEAYTPEDIVHIVLYQAKACYDNSRCADCKDCKIKRPCGVSTTQGIENIVRAMKEDAERLNLKGGTK